MSSGIYKLTFKSGKYYIGKSVDIEGRWLQHYEAFRKGTAAIKMQAEYNNSGMPIREIIVECHPEHIDVLEPHLINRMYSTEMLNTSIPLDPLPDVEDVFNTKELDMLKYSTFSLVSKLLEVHSTLENLKASLITPESIRSAELKLLYKRTEIAETSLKTETLKETVRQRFEKQNKPTGFFAWLFR